MQLQRQPAQGVDKVSQPAATSTAVSLGQLLHMQRLLQLETWSRSQKQLLHLHQLLQLEEALRIQRQ